MELEKLFCELDDFCYVFYGKCIMNVYITSGCQIL